MRAHVHYSERKKNPAEIAYWQAAESFQQGVILRILLNFTPYPCLHMLINVDALLPLWILLSIMVDLK